MSLPLQQQLATLALPITRLATDSRAVGRGDTFIACPGEIVDGRQFIAQAIANGANAVIYEKQLSGHPADGHDFAWNESWNVPNLAVADLRHKAGMLADIVYESPSKALWMVGVTGTNGKTSICHWIAQALNLADKKCTLIGTLGNGFSGALTPSANTTPDAVCVQSLLAEYRDSGAAACAMEVSSHALTQGRVNGVHFDVALLTNLSRDHLDYHGDMESYAAAKRRLFEWQDLKFAVINLDDAFGVELARQLSGGAVEVIGYGLTDEALHRAERAGMRMVHGNLLKMNGQGLRLQIHSSWGAGELTSGMVGRFNASNLLGALAALLAGEMTLRVALDNLSQVTSALGRMQRVGGENLPTVIVDYAHTPDALEKVLLALREVCEPGGRLICVFGCGGDRDRGKRAMMGRVAERFSDYCIVTSDNPRSEVPEHIIAEVVGGMVAGNHEILINRAQAIEAAITIAKPCDTVLLAGKGHEEYQEINKVKHAFSDVTVAIQALEKYIHTGGVR